MPNVKFIRISFLISSFQLWPWLWGWPRLSWRHRRLWGILQEPSLRRQCWPQVIRSLRLLHQEQELSGVSQLPHPASSRQTEDCQAFGGLTNSTQLVQVQYSLLFFGSVRSSRRDDLCPSVCLSVTSALVWLEQSIFIFLTKIFNLFSRISLSSLSPNSQLSLGSLGILRWKDGAYNNSSCLLIYWPLIGSGWPHPT